MLKRLGKLRARVNPKSVLIVGIPVLLLCIISRCFSISSSSPETEGTLWVPVSERPSVDLSGFLTTLEGGKVALEDLRNKALLLNVWATWCAPCRIEMPFLAELHENLSDEGLTIVTISSEDPAAVQAYLDEIEVEQPFPFLLDTDNILADRFGVYGLPTTIVIDPKGRLALRHVGVYSWNSPKVVRGLRQLMGE